MITFTWVVCSAVVTSASCFVCPDCLAFDMRISGGCDMVPIEQRHLGEGIAVEPRSTHTAASCIGGGGDN